MSSTAGHPLPPRLGPLAAAAWVEAIVRYWQGVRARLAPACPLPVLDLAPQGEAIHLMLPALAECAARTLGFVPRLRYLACTPGGEVPPAWRQAPALRGWLDDGSLVAAKEDPEAWPGADGATQNPLVVLAHGAWGRLPQRLFAIHYGRLLEFDMNRRPAMEGHAAAGAPWQPATPPEGDGHVAQLMKGYQARLNSAPVCWPGGAMGRISHLARTMPQGGLVLAMDHGFVSERQFRLCGFERFATPRSIGLPVNFQLLEAAWRERGAVTWQLALPREQAVQVAVVDQPGCAGSLLAEVVVPLRSGAFADASAMTRLAAGAARQDDDSQLLALLRHSRHDPAVFAAACPHIHDSLLAKPDCDRAGWAAALRRVAANHLPMAGQPGLHAGIALGAMRIGEWGLARHVLERGMQAHGESVEDLLGLADCDAATGRLNDAEAWAMRALARRPGDARAVALLERLRAKRSRWDDEWRRCLAHPELPLVLEPLDIDHAEAMLHQYRDPQISVMTGLPSLAGLEETRRWIEAQLGERDRCDHAVMHAEAGLVGHVALAMSPEAALLCFWAGVDHQGRGLAVEAARLLCGLARERGYEWIFAEAFCDNARSIRALQRAGFVPMGLRTVCSEQREVLCYGLDDARRSEAVDALRACMQHIDRDPLLLETIAPRAPETVA